MIEIDGSHGEGGGQILRTALSLSCLFNKPFRIFNIRKGRGRPGLMPQHLTCVRAAQLLTDAEVRGDYHGSTDLTFFPKGTRGGEFFFDIGTAGSTSLLLQTILPSLIFSKEKTTVTLKGGTHVPFSPSFHYIREVFLPTIERVGVRMELTIESYGFYPKGGGKIRADVFPSGSIKPLNAILRGRVVRLRGCSGVGNLPLTIAERQRRGLLEGIRSMAADLDCPVDIGLLEAPNRGQGTFVFLCAESENSIAGFTSLGERGKRAEAVGEDVAGGFLRYYSTGAAFDPYLPDQIVIYLSMSSGKSVFSTSCITRHLVTNLWVIGLFHNFDYSIEGEVGRPGRITIMSAQS